MNQVLNLAEGLLKLNSKIKIHPEILFFTYGPAIEEAEQRGIPYRLLLKKSFLDFIFKLCKFLKKNKYDIVHTHTINGNFFGRVASKLSGHHLLLTTVHSHIFDELKGLRQPATGDRLRYGIDLFLSRWTKTLVTVSEAIRKRLISNGLPPEKIRTINNTVNIKTFKPDPYLNSRMRKEMKIPVDAKVIGIIGRIIPLKNHDIFLGAARCVVDTTENVRFLIIGDGPLMKETKALSSQLGLSDKVIFTGWRLDMDRLISVLDVLVMCSQIEGLNVAILEAMASGKPIIGTNVKGIKIVVKQGKNGILINVRDKNALADAIIYLINHPGIAKEMGEAGRKLVEDKYSSIQMVDAYCNLYKEVCKR